MHSPFGTGAALTPATQSEMEAGVETSLRSTSPLLISQAIAALAVGLDWTASGVGTIHLTNLPATALTSVQTAVSEAAMLGLTTEEGDVVVRSDELQTYMHHGGVAGTMADFTLLSTPTDEVTSVDGATGVILLNHNTLTGYVADEHIDWSATNVANIHPDNYTNTDTTYSVEDGGLTEINFTSTRSNKLDGIEEDATADQTGYIGNSKLTAAHTLVLTDAGKIVELDVATANDVTIPLDSAVAFPVDTRIDIYQHGIGKTTIVGEIGVTVRGMVGSRGQFLGMSLWKRAADDWVVFGGGP